LFNFKIAFTFEKTKPAMAKTEKTAKQIDISTEEKIKEAARVVFTRKGFVAAKVRDIAAEAGINLSLVNYYFRSKEKLFEIIMAETVRNLFSEIKHIINDEQTSIIRKIELITDHYIDMLIRNPDFPLFLVNEVMSGSDTLTAVIRSENLFWNSHFAKQLIELKTENKIQFHPLHLLLNVLGLIVFPFFGRPLLIKSSLTTAEEFTALIEERKKLIPAWISMILKG